MEELPVESAEQVFLVDPEEERKRIFDFNTAKPRIDRLLQNWCKEETNTDLRRKQRNIEVNVEDLHAAGELKDDETLIPVRTIDSNIRKEQPAYMSFIKQSRRLAIFKLRGHTGDASQTERLETAFTEGMQYSGWETPFHKVVDGAQAHGWDVVEVEFDESKPLNCGVDHVGHDNFIFDLKAKNIQACETVARKYELSTIQLKTFVQKYGFNAAATKEIFDKLTNNQDDQPLTTVYKVFSKYQGVVYVAWYCKEANDWLKATKPLFIGRRSKTTSQKTELTTQVDPISGIPIQVPIVVPMTVWIDTPEELYPFHLLRYMETEEQCIANQRGRCFLDGPKQDAQTGLWTTFVNGSVRAGNVYSSPKETSPENTGTPKRLDVVLEHGCIYNQALVFWHPDYPSEALIRASEGLNTQTQVETGQIAYGAMNREDSRKTAKEITVAQEQSQLLNSVQVALFSIFVREVYTHCWLIVQSQALQNLIPFMQEPINQVDATGMPTTVYQNNMQVIGQDYDVKAAGDVDVVQRAEKLQRRLMMWPIVSMTALANMFLLDILKEAFPEDADRYKAYLDSIAMQMQQQQMMMQMQGQQQQPTQ